MNGIDEVTIAAVTLWTGVTLYAVFGGADFGAGFWDLLAGGGREGQRRRAMINDAIGPVWEANHTWLIFDLVILWTAFPPAFAAIMTSLFVPLSLAAFGIVMRGAAFAFRPVAEGPSARRLASLFFGASSVVTPFFLGTAAGAIAAGRVAVPPALPDLLASWVHPTAILVGVLAVAVCAYLAAVFLVADARRLGLDDLAESFLRRATAAAVVAGGVAVAGIPIVAVDAPVLGGELIRRGWPLIVASGVLGTAALLQLRRGAPAGTRVLAVGAVVSVVWGWGIAQYPDVLPGTLSLAAAAAPIGSLQGLLLVSAAAAILIAPSLGLLFLLDQRSRLEREHSAGGREPRGDAGEGGRSA